jgi:hypothetical protein
MGSHRTRYPAGIDFGASTASDHVEAFHNDVSKLSTAGDGYRSLFAGILNSPAADPDSVRVSRTLPL